MAKKNNLPKAPVTVMVPPAQCGMNFLSNLANATTILQQIEVLDFAFNHWGRAYMHYSSDESDPSFGNLDRKSQVFFTDTVQSEKIRWPEIKALCVRGPVTPNSRYAPGPFRNDIAVYILVREVYEAWRDEYMQKNKSVKPEVDPKQDLEQVIKEITPVDGPAPEQVEQQRVERFFNLNQ